MPHVSEQHAQHDSLLVVSLAAGDVTGAERDLAVSLITSCGDCAALHDDLLAIAKATAAIPPAARVRDFRLTPAQAARLRPGGWRRFVAAFGSPRLTRQLGVGLTTLGLAGLLVSVLPTLPIGGMASTAGASPAALEAQSASDGFIEASGAEAGASAAAAPAGSAAAPAPTIEPAAVPSSDAGLTPFASRAPVRTSTDDKATPGNVTAQGPDAVGSPAAQRQVVDEAPTERPGISLVVLASAILLAAGIALLAARRIARGVTGA
jgi:AhpD family alkylhydroperoxidase